MSLSYKILVRLVVSPVMSHPSSRHEVGGTEAYRTVRHFHVILLRIKDIIEMTNHVLVLRYYIEEIIRMIPEYYVECIQGIGGYYHS